jgi:hypothetical protein
MTLMSLYLILAPSQTSTTRIVEQNHQSNKAKQTVEPNHQRLQQDPKDSPAVAVSIDNQAEPKESPTVKKQRVMQNPQKAVKRQPSGSAIVPGRQLSRALR